MLVRKVPEAGKHFSFFFFWRVVLLLRPYEADNRHLEYFIRFWLRLHNPNKNAQTETEVSFPGTQFLVFLPR